MPSLIAMKRPKTASESEAVSVPLKVNDQLFLNANFSNGQNATQAYLAVHPNVKYGSAEVLGYRQLGKVRVHQEIQRRLVHEQGITLKGLTIDLLTAKSWASDAHDYAAYASITLDCAKLAGLLVEKREVKTVNEEQSSAIRQLVQQSMTSSPPVMGTG